VEKEVQAIERLCGPGAHVNIVQVLNHGLLWDFPYYYIDMELCDMNLSDYIQSTTLADSSKSLPRFVKGGGTDSLLQIWTVMSQIASGVEYIHCEHQIHRDIKPGNGVPLSVAYLTC
jgi:serine/threonine protein kinase